MQIIGVCKRHINYTRGLTGFLSLFCSLHKHQKTVSLGLFLQYFKRFRRAWHSTVCSSYLVQNGGDKEDDGKGSTSRHPSADERVVCMANAPLVHGHVPLLPKVPDRLGIPACSQEDVASHYENVSRQGWRVPSK